MDRIVAYGVVVLLTAGAVTPLAAQSATPSRPAATPPRPAATPPPTASQPRPAARPASPAAKRPARAAAPAPQSSAKFDGLVRDAAAAREGKQLDKAIDLYKQALAIRPSWDEGQWNLGTVLYEVERFAEARDAFRRVTAAHPDHGTAWALKGLCEFRLQNYDAALEDLAQARRLPITGGQEVLDVARYHAGILLTRAGQFDQALMILNEFATQGNETPGVIEAMGLAVLRMPMLPADLPGTKRELVLMAGRARYFQASRHRAGARNAYELLISRYPDTPNTHYAYGVFLLAEEPDRAIEVLERELKVSPQNVYAKLQIAFAYIRKGDYEKALPWARDGAAEAPTDYVAHHAYGQALLETGDVAGALIELEAGVKLAPDSPIMHFVLAKAYRRAGRQEDAEKAQQAFLRLDKQFREARTGSESIGGIPLDGPPDGRNP
jgi:tetratricopeptide (TPR) repeat protein